MSSLFSLFNPTRTPHSKNVNPIKNFCRLPGAVLCAALLATSAQADTLGEIYELALTNDPVLKAAEATFKADRELGKQGLARLLPQVTASAGYNDSKLDSTSTRFDETTVSLQQLDFDTDGEDEVYTATLSQQIFNLPLWFGFKQSKQLSARAEAEFAKSQQELIVRTAEAYLDVLRAQDNLRTARAEERAIYRQLEQTQQRYEVGLIAITDVHEAQAAYDLSVVNRLSEEVNLGTSIEGLTVLTGREHANLQILKDDFVVQAPTPNDRQQWVDFALQNNLTLKSAQLAVEAARQNARSKRSAHLPTISGSYNYNDTDTDEVSTVGGVFDFDSDSAAIQQTLSIKLEMPLFQGGAISSERRQAAQQYQRDNQNLVATKRNTVQDARALFLTVVTDVARIRARNQSIVSAQSALEATQAGYDAGTRNIVDLLNAQRDLYSARRDYANTRYDYVINTFRLKETAGTLSPQDIYDLDAAMVPAPEVSRSELSNSAGAQ